MALSNVSAFTLEKMLSHFSIPLNELNGSKYKDKKLRIVGASDIAFCNKGLGMAGGNSTCGCFKCEATQSEMQIPRKKRKPSKKRTLKNLQENYEGYARTGFDKKRQAEFKNVITRALLLIEPDDWIVPYLHCMLGEILKFWTLTENKCLEIELKLSKLIAAKGGHFGDTKFEEYIKHMMDVVKVEQKISDILRQINRITNDIQNGVVPGENGIRHANKELDCLQSKRAELSSEVKSLYTKKKLELGDGPITSQLEKILDDHKIKREHYYGGIINGNSCDRFLKVFDSVYNTIYLTVKSVAEATGHLEILNDAFELVVHFKTLFYLRRNVHELISHSNPIFEHELPGIQKAIDEYLGYYRL